MRINEKGKSSFLYCFFFIASCCYFIDDICSVISLRILIVEFSFLKFSYLYIGLSFFQAAFLFAAFGHYVCCPKLSLEVW